MSKLTLIAPLSNVNANVPLPVQLTEGVEIDSIRPQLIPFLKRALQDRLIRHPVSFNHSIVIRNAVGVKEDASDLREEIEEVVLRLRLYKAGGVGFSFAIVDSEGWYDNPPTTEGAHFNFSAIAVFFYNVWDRPGIPSQLEIGADDIEPLKTLFAKSAGRKLMRNSAFRNFFRGYHEPYATDRFLSNAIGLENLLVNDTNDRSNYRYKFADRGCFLLQRAGFEPSDPEIQFKDLRDIYDSRSQIVHSNEQPDGDWHKEDDIKKLRNSENYLRHLLLYVLDHQQMEKSDSVDRAKRLCYKLAIGDAG